MTYFYIPWKLRKRSYYLASIFIWNYKKGFSTLLLYSLETTGGFITLLLYSLEITWEVLLPYFYIHWNLRERSYYLTTHGKSPYAIEKNLNFVRPFLGIKDRFPFIYFYIHWKLRKKSHYLASIFHWNHWKGFNNTSLLYSFETPGKVSIPYFYIPWKLRKRFYYFTSIFLGNYVRGIKTLLLYSLEILGNYIHDRF